MLGALEPLEQDHLGGHDLRATAGQSYSSLTTVNGSVYIQGGASVENAKTVNGEVELEKDAKAGHISAVNGGLTLHEGAVVEHAASTVNGEIRLAAHASAGEIATVSGDIELSGAEVKGGIETYNGNVDLSDGAHVLGGIVVRKPNESERAAHGHAPRGHVCSTCVIEGELRFERPVNLQVDAGGKIGKVTGETVKTR